MRISYVRALLTLALAATLSSTAPAQFVFIHSLPVPGGSAVHAGFGEPGEWDRRLARHIEPTTYAVRTADGKEADLRLSYDDRAECYLAVARHGGPAVILGVCDYGLSQRPKAKPVLLTYYAARYTGAPGSWAKLAGSPRLKVELRPAFDGQTVRVTALGDGKPLAKAEVSVWGPGGSRKLTTDDAGQASWPGDGPGEYALWVGRGGQRDFDAKGKGKSKSVATRDIATLSFALPDVKARPAEAKPDAKAAERLAQARRAAAAWGEKFPGFTAALRVDHDGGTATGTVEVAADGAVSLTLDGDAALKREVHRRIASLARHRAPAKAAAGVATRGTSLVPLGDPFASRYWVKDGQLTAVRRVAGGRQVEVRVLASRKAAGGAAVPTVFATAFRDLNGRLREAEAERRDWVEVGGHTLPGQFVITRAASAVPGAGEGWSSLTLTFTAHKLGAGQAGR